MLKIVHPVSVTGYQATFSGTFGRLVLGTEGSYGVEQINLTLGADWEGLVVTANFVTDAGTTPVVVPESGLFDVPPEATDQQGLGSLVLQGTAAGVQIYTVNIPYIVMAHADVSGQAPAPTPDKWEQYIVQVQGIVDKAVPPGGNIGDVLTKTADGNAWQAPQGGGGGAGQDGGYYTPSIQQTTDSTAQFSWTASDDAMPPVEPVTLTLPQGKPGQNGDAAGFGTISASATDLQPGQQPTVQAFMDGPDTAKNITLAFGIPAGQNGEAGENAGFGTLSATASQLPAGSQPTVQAEWSGENTEKNLSLSFGIPAGSNGDPGDAAGFGSISATATQLSSDAQPTVQASWSGPNTAKNLSLAFGIPAGPQGPAYTLTPEDTQMIVQAVLTALPNGDEVSY